MGNCKYCGGKAGLLRRKHRECDAAYQAGWERMVALVADAAGQPGFSEAALRDDLAAIAGGSYVDDDGIRAALAQGWRQAVKEGLADGILTQDEEARLRDFREQFAIAESEKPARQGFEELQRAARERLSQEARIAALARDGDGGHLVRLEAALEESGLAAEERQDLLTKAWRDAVAEALEDRALAADEEQALTSYLRHFGLSAEDVSSRRNAAYTRMQQGARERLLLEARRAAKGSAAGSDPLGDLAAALEASEVAAEERWKLLAQAWEDAVSEALADGGLSLAEERALAGYLRYFKLTAAEVNGKRAYDNMMRGIRERLLPVARRAAIGNGESGASGGGATGVGGNGATGATGRNGAGASGGNGATGNGASGSTGASGNGTGGENGASSATNGNGGGEALLARLEVTLAASELPAADRPGLLAEAWEAAVESSLEDGALSLDEENALVCYLRHFGLSEGDVNRNGAYTSMIQSAVIREAAEGLIPDRLGDIGRMPFNLMKSERLVWVIDGVDYFEVKTRRERRGSSHGASIRVAKGLYYRPSTFRSQAVEWEETVHADTGLLGITSKHLYFHGARKRFRIRYDRVVSFSPYNDGMGVMRDAQTAKPQSFRTGDGWFVYNLVTNLAQHW